MIYKFKDDFRDYQLLLKLFENSRDGGVNPKEALRSQARFKLDLKKIKVAGNKSEDQ